MIIGLSAKIGCGKTTLANMLLEKLPMYERIAFGDVLKEEAARIFRFPVEWAYSEEGKGRVPSCPGVIHHFTPKQDMTVRELLQWYGTDVCRAKDPAYWTKRMAERIQGKQNVLIDDVRFPDEAAFVKDRGGMMVRIDPYPGWLPGPYAKHISETALDNYYDFDLILEPEYGKLREKAEQVLDLLVLFSKPRVYLACPYSHPDHGVREARKCAADRKAAELMSAGYIVFSPLSHSHALADHLPEDLRCSWDFWQLQDLPLVDWADEVHVLCLQGWQSSVGVQHEIRHAEATGKPVRYIEVCQ